MISLLFPVAWAIGVYMGEMIFPYRIDIFPRWIHTLRQLCIAGIVASIQLCFLFTAIPYVCIRAEAARWGILNRVTIPAVAGMCVAFILFDLWMYWWHRANHRIPLLWRLHRAHHNDIAMDSTTALRFHPVEVVISSVLNLAIIAVYGLRTEHLFVYNIVFQPVIFFHHSNLRVPAMLDSVLRSLIVTPAMHRIHHSVEVVETNSNYGSVFSFWDRFFGTYTSASMKEKITIGLPYFREIHWQGIWGFLKIPFSKIV